ncbi:urokinase plasminogen activator surface receptor-like [Genypterus blacodes]|uniref:urokinase plasminogen activator surface receptor-like n=1 Tax=Genypterus blacodes TaxID=154954 RepID=UPI003F76E0F2
MMHLFILGIIGSLLLSGAYSLDCHECIPGAAGTCTDKTITCPTGTQCGAYRVITLKGNSKTSDIQGKACVTADVCVTGSANFGVLRAMYTSKCCNTKLCNTDPAPEVAKTIPNGKKCYSCTTNKCNTTQPCEGEEDHCITSTVMEAGKNTTAKGCATKSVCTGKIAAKLGTEDVNCCQGNFCNSASSIAVNLLLLLLPLLSSALF